MSAEAKLTKFEWMTTNASGRSKTHGADAGVTGWKLHMVDTLELRDGQRRIFGRSETVMIGNSLCGIRAQSGWGLDLFIDDECSRCVAIAEKRGIQFP